ncbi:MAG: helix-turn-helix domain-containing protein [Carboxylicivirga sp.]|jgi:phenylacetate-coenzyme A ligase PaaK-like adenylate-forming protein|nr:helix-turn-helix domain-containing protein [Carboxylicivirga sp.]
MALKSERDVSYGREKIYRDQIVTIGDLKDFKEDLLQQLSKIVAENLTPTKKWMKSAEVRKLLDISPGTLQNMRDNGSLPYTKVGGTIFYDIKDIQKMFSKNKVAAITRFNT